MNIHTRIDLHYVCVCDYIYIYIYREREREILRDIMYVYGKYGNPQFNCYVKSTFSLIISTAAVFSSFNNKNNIHIPLVYIHLSTISLQVHHAACSHCASALPHHLQLSPRQAPVAPHSPTASPTSCKAFTLKTMTLLY